MLNNLSCVYDSICNIFNTKVTLIIMILLMIMCIVINIINGIKFKDSSLCLLISIFGIFCGMFSLILWSYKLFRIL